MSSYLPDPWSFSNCDPNLIAPNKNYKIEYEYIQEFAMGSPKVGKCYLITKANEHIIIDYNCGGPIIWNELGNMLAVPIWVNTLLKGKVQRLCIIDLASNKSIIFEKTFNVLYLQKFIDNTITAIENPLVKNKLMVLDITKLKIHKSTIFTHKNYS